MILETSYTSSGQDQTQSLRPESLTRDVRKAGTIIAIAQFRQKALFLLLVLVTAALVIALTVGSNTRAAHQQQGDSEKSQIPVTRYASSESVNSAVPQVRRDRNSRYDKRRPKPISELANGAQELPLITHSTWGIAALPGDQSDTVVIGEVVDAQAHLSNDRTGVYSEFTVQIKEVLKGSAALKPGDPIALQREGGAVRFPSGRVQEYRIENQGFPSVGRSYVFFLNHSDEGQDYSVLTAYELRRGRVLPLDNAEQFRVYKDVDAASFLSAVRESLKGGRSQ